MPLNQTGTTLEVEPYKLSEIFSIIPEFEGDQIFLGNFLNACDCAYDMATTQQKTLLVIHLKNKLKGRAGQLISSRNPNSYLEIKQLLNLHFGDSRDLSALIHDLQRLKQLPGESPLTFYNRLQVLNAKMHASIQKSPLLKTTDQKEAQSSLVESMALNTLLTGLEPRMGQIIRAGCPHSLLDAQSRIRREMQLSHFENQKTTKTFPQKVSVTNKTQQSSIKCFSCGRLGHTANQCRQQTSSARPNSSQYPNQNFQRTTANYSTTTNQQPMSNFQQNRTQDVPNSKQFIQRPPTNTQRNGNFYPNQQRTYHLNDSPDGIYAHEFEYAEPSYYEQDISYEEGEYTEQFTTDPENNQDFLVSLSDHHPPENTTQDQVSDIQNQIQLLNIDDMSPNVNFPEQAFL